MIAAFMFGYIRHGRPYIWPAAAAATYETAAQSKNEVIVLMCKGGSEQCFYKTPEQAGSPQTLIYAIQIL